MDITYATFTSYGALVKLDMDGKVLFSKIFSNNIDSGVDVHVKYLVVNQLIRISNDSISLNGWVNKLMSSIGYSTDSYVDQIIINFDSNGYTKWASVFEYNSTYDSAGDMALYDSILYSSLFAEGYACFLVLIVQMEYIFNQIHLLRLLIGYQILKVSCFIIYFRNEYQSCNFSLYNIK